MQDSPFTPAQTQQPILKITNNPSAASPHTGTLVLPQSGEYLVTYHAIINGTISNSAVATERVTFILGNPNYIRSHAAIGTAAFSNATPVGVNSLALAAPAIDGTLTATVAWTDGQAHPSEIRITATLLAPLQL